MQRNLVVLLLCFALTSFAQVPLAIKGVTLIDGSGNHSLENATVLVIDDRISLIGEGGTLVAPDNTREVDGTGKTLVPGIINLHGHVGLTKGLEQSQQHYTRENIIENLKVYAAYGVTTTTSLGTDRDSVLRVRDDIRQGRLPGLARVLTALNGLTTVDGYPTQAPGVKGLVHEVKGTDEARKAVNEVADAGAGLFKVWVDSHHGTFVKVPSMIYAAAIEEAHSRGLVTAAHVYERADAEKLAAAGIDIMAHSVRDKDVNENLIRVLRAKDVTYAATLTREQSTFVYADKPNWLSDPFFTSHVPEPVLEALATTMLDTQTKDPENEINRKNYSMAMRNLKALADAGVTIGFATDTGPPGRFAGYFEHWEAELMVEAGLSPMQVIVAYSKNNSEALEIDRDFGTLAEGKVADMILLNSNPLEDIRNLRDIEAVYIGGREVSR